MLNAKLKYSPAVIIGSSAASPKLRSQGNASGSTP
jgi:hypothetical protein